MFCWFCGAEIKNDALYCQKCGNRVIEESTDAIFHDEEKEKGWKPEEPKRSSKRFLIPLIAGGAFIVFFVVLIVATISQEAEDAAYVSDWEDEYADEYVAEGNDDSYDQDGNNDDEGEYDESYEGDYDSGYDENYDEDYYEDGYDENYDEDYYDSEYDDGYDESSEGDTELPHPSPTDEMVEGIKSSWRRSDDAWNVPREQWGNLLWDWDYRTHMYGGPTFSGKTFVFSFTEVCSFTGFYYQGDLDQEYAKPKKIRFMFYSLYGDGTSSQEIVDDLPNSYEEQAINFEEYHEGDHIEVSILDGYGTPFAIILSEFHFY